MGDSEAHVWEIVVTVSVVVTMFVCMAKEYGPPGPSVRTLLATRHMHARTHARTDVRACAVHGETAGLLLLAGLAMRKRSGYQVTSVCSLCTHTAMVVVHSTGPR